MFKHDLPRYRRLLKEGSWIVVGQVVSVAGTLVLVRVLTEYLTPVEYGQLALGLTVAVLIGQVVMGGISLGIGRYYSIASERSDLTGYLKDSRRLLAYGTLAVVMFGVVLMAGLLSLGYSHWMGLAAAALVLSLLSGYNGTLNGIQNAARQRAIVAFHGGLDAWLKILFAIGAMLWFGTSSTAVVVGYSCSALLVTLSQLVFLRRTIPRQTQYPGHHQSWAGQIWRYSWPFSAWGLFTWMQQVSDRWSLEAFATTQEMGLYVVVFQLGYAPISLVLGMAMAFLGPILYQRAGDATDPSRNENVHRLSWRITAVALVVTGFAFLLTWLLHEWLFRILVATEYREISYLLPWVILAGGLFAAAQMLSLKLMSGVKSTDLLAPKVITALLGVAFNAAGAALAGLHGVVGALVAFSCIYLLWMVLLGRALQAEPRHLASETR